MNFVAINSFVMTKLIPTFNAVMGKLPALLSTTEADAQVALQDILKLVSDLQASVNELISTVKSA